MVISSIHIHVHTCTQVIYPVNCILIYHTCTCSYQSHYIFNNKTYVSEMAGESIWIKGTNNINYNN